MEVVVFWTDTAIGQLDAIFDYYKTRAGESVAQNLIQSVIDSTIILQSHPETGQVEPLLTGRKYQYRYLVSGNYKIIYRLKKSSAIIASVFDCRQNPLKMKKGLKL